MKKLDDFICAQFFSDDYTANIVGLILIFFLGLSIIFGIYRIFKPSYTENKQNNINISDKKQTIDCVVSLQPKYYICSYCGSKYRYFQINCDNCGANHIDFIKKNN